MMSEVKCSCDRRTVGQLSGLVYGRPYACLILDNVTGVMTRFLQAAGGRRAGTEGPTSARDTSRTDHSRHGAGLLFSRCCFLHRPHASCRPLLRLQITAAQHSNLLLHNITQQWRKAQDQVLPRLTDQSSSLESLARRKMHEQSDCRRS